MITLAILISSCSSCKRLFNLPNLLIFCWSSHVTSVSDPPPFTHYKQTSLNQNQTMQSEKFNLGFYVTCCILLIQIRCMVFTIQKTVPLQAWPELENQRVLIWRRWGRVWWAWAYNLSWFSFGQSSRKLILPHLFFKNRSPPGNGF